MNFQINSKTLFLTYPECPLSPNDALEKFQKIFLSTNIDKYVIAREKHKNGNDHLHCFIQLVSQYRSRNPKFADLDGYHGNYQGCRSSKNVLKYCTKDDNFISNFDVGEALSKGKSKKEILGKRILEGEDLDEIVQEHPELIFGYKRLKEDIEEFKASSSRKDRSFDVPGEVPNPWGKTLPVETDNKKCHYWLFSTVPNKGKTTGVIMPLIRDHGAVLYDPQASYHEVTEFTSCIVIDELRKGSIRYDVLNQICDGLKKFRIFMKGYISIIDKPLVVICSNFSINDVFPFKNELVHARFIEICCDDFNFA